MPTLRGISHSVLTSFPNACCILRKPNLTYLQNRRLSNSSLKLTFKVLGIETSCDDTGVAIVDSERRLLADAIHNQSQIHLE